MKEMQALVTGSTRGIGSAIAQALETLGVAVVRHGRASNVDIPEPDYWQADFYYPYEALKSWKAWLKTRGIPALLVNNAGYFERDTLLTPTAWDTCLNVNFHAPCLLTTELLKYPAAPLTVVNILSTAALQPREDAYSYSESKRLLMHWMQQLRKREAAYDTSLRIINVYPGPVLTDAWAKDEPRPARILRPEDIAAYVMDLIGLSEKSEIAGTEELIITA